MYDLYSVYIWKIVSVFANHIMFVNPVALIIQFTSKWTGSDIVKENFKITQAQCVMGDCNSSEQSI